MPSSALPAWPHGLLEGFDWPLGDAAADLTDGLRGAVGRAACFSARSARCAAAARLRSFASALSGVRILFGAGLAPGGRAAARLPARRAAAALRLIRTTALFP